MSPVSVVAFLTMTNRGQRMTGTWKRDERRREIHIFITFNDIMKALFECYFIYLKVGVRYIYNIYGSNYKNE